MSRKGNKKRADGVPKRKAWSLSARGRRTLLTALAMVASIGLIGGGFVGLKKLDAHVDHLLLLDRPDPVVEFVDLPKELYSLANYDLQKSLFDALGRDWTDDRLCAEIAARVGTVGWVGKVHHVRRTGGGRFEISCRYRDPAAIVLHQQAGYLVDVDGTRLPGTYVQHSAWRTVFGVQASPPQTGDRWEGDDVRTGLAVLSAVQSEPFAQQIVGVAVENHAGRSDPRTGHVELVTDRPGGRIHWGSAPGMELEENGVGQKLALLRKNYADTGRADAGHVVIDVSVFPDRYTVPDDALGALAVRP
jgi:hypothetical protein